MKSINVLQVVAVLLVTGSLAAAELGDYTAKQGTTAIFKPEPYGDTYLIGDDGSVLSSLSTVCQR